jgi:ribosomal protein L11 methyltransferase
MNDFRKFTVDVVEEKREMVLAFMSLLNCDMIEETSEGFSLSFELDDTFEASKREFLNVMDRFELSFEEETVKAQNWNSVWESSFQPIFVNDYAQIRASFHEQKKDYKHDLLIDPQMSFGTGHHATTYMMVDAMSSMDFDGKDVMDYGCGTGILAILAAKEGAKSILAFDIEANAHENSLSNAKINGVAHISIFQGVLDQVEEQSTFDYILANINRNVILESLSTLRQHLRKGGNLLISGILEKDVELVVAKAEEAGLKPLKMNTREGWVCYLFTSN